MQDDGCIRQGANLSEDLQIKLQTFTLFGVLILLEKRPPVSDNPIENLQEQCIRTYMKSNKNKIAL